LRFLCWKSMKKGSRLNNLRAINDTGDKSQRNFAIIPGVADSRAVRVS
jgi:hypothetical protein